MSNTQVNLAALRAHAATGWSEDCLIPKSVILLLVDELQASRAHLAAQPQAAPSGLNKSEIAAIEYAILKLSDLPAAGIATNLTIDTLQDILAAAQQANGSAK